MDNVDDAFKMGFSFVETDENNMKQLDYNQIHKTTGKEFPIQFSQYDLILEFMSTGGS